MKRTLAIVAALLLSSCATTSPPPATGTDTEPVTEATLQELRLEYGLPDCPETAPDAEAVDDGLPRTALQCLGSDKVVNLAGLPRRPMVINLWAQWCGPCRVEAPFLREIHQTRDDVDLIGINYNDPKPDWALEFASLVEWNYPHIEDMDKTLQTSLGVPGLPMTLLVDADGVVQYKHPGQFESTEQLTQLIEEYL